MIINIKLCFIIFNIKSPTYSSKTGKLKTTYKHENVTTTADFDLSLSAGPLIHATAVIGYQGKFKAILKIFFNINVFFKKDLLLLILA